MRGTWAVRSGRLPVVARHVAHDDVALDDDGTAINTAAPSPSPILSVSALLLTVPSAVVPIKDPSSTGGKWKLRRSLSRSYAGSLLFERIPSCSFVYLLC
ncbi:hypothetical protein OPV22_030143 [Ensete ventricosum]|uniref:Uncharacterized protein n=1 Tax=Ensete ventricosum TaxID=4639 RepID=A0AAV8Q5B3_ENSVE|nr:hypothetical protein OPV22_030143 [Ensete ventricosum]